MKVGDFMMVQSGRPVSAYSCLVSRGICANRMTTPDSAVNAAIIKNAPWNGTSVIQCLA